MKCSGMIVLIVLFVGLLSVYDGNTASKESRDLAVLSSRGDISELTGAQVTARENVGQYMDRYLIQGLKKQGYNALLLNNKEEWSGTGYLLQVTIVGLKEVSKKARFWGGMMAGANTLNLHYDLLDSQGKSLLSWDDGVGSTKSSRHCAQALNKKAVQKITSYFKEN